MFHKLTRVVNLRRRVVCHRAAYKTLDRSLNCNYHQTPHTQYEFTHRETLIRKQTYCFLIYTLHEEAEDKTASCSLWQKKYVNGDWMNLSDIFAHTAYSVFCSQNITFAWVWVTLFFNLALRQENNTSFYLTWQWDREALLFFIFPLIYLALNQKDVFLYFLLLEGKEGGEEKRRTGEGSKLQS